MDTVDYMVADGIARIYLNRPARLNATVPQLVDELCLALDMAARDRVGVVILGGRGRAFCSGHDLKQDVDDASDTERLRNLQRIQSVTRKIRQAPYVVIAAVHGYSLGAGCEFALCSDLVIAAEGTIFGFPEVEVGLSMTGGISHVLPIAIGLAKAKELALLGRRFTAEEALQLGLINRVVPPDQLASASIEFATALRDKPRRALLYAKTLLDRGPQGDIEVACELEVAVAQALYGSADGVAATAAFRAKSAAKHRDM